MMPSSQPPTLPAAPATGAAQEIADGILWIRIPLPFRLNHVNVWAIEDDGGWAIVDCGVDGAEHRRLWDELRDGPLRGKPVRRLIATHGHTDHVGLSGHVVERFGARYETTLIEWMSARLRYADYRAGESGSLARFLAAHGCGPEMVESYKLDRARVSRHLGPQPGSILRLRHGDEVRIGPRRWRVIVGAGHADEHASFHAPADRILIAGDQVLPRISPVVAVFPGEPDADPLGAYLASLERFRELDPATLVLPSHGEPFLGPHRRLTELAEHHAQRLDALEALIRRPVTATVAAEGLFARAVREGQGRLALAETLAHLHRLMAAGRALRSEDDHGRYVFTSGPAPP